MSKEACIYKKVNGIEAYLAGIGRVLSRGASSSDPLTGFLRD